MKRVLFAAAFAVAAGGQVLAADVPVPGYSPYVPAVPLYSWTGFYAGVNGGGAFGNSNWTDPVFAPSGNFSVNGFLIGGTLGGNYQVGSWVFGLEGDADWANLNGTTFNTSCVNVGCETSSDFLATIRGRVGYAWDRLLVYGTAGAAFGDIQAAAGVFPFMSSTQAGWTAGAGLEYAITPILTAKVEYLFVDLGSASCGPANCGGTNTSVSLNENVVRAGLNYRFGGWW
jgi:outer membrane immunogenic protein